MTEAYIFDAIRTPRGKGRADGEARDCAYSRGIPTMRRLALAATLLTVAACAMPDYNTPEGIAAGSGVISDPILGRKAVAGPTVFPDDGDIGYIVRGAQDGRVQVLVIPKDDRLSGVRSVRTADGRALEFTYPPDGVRNPAGGSAAAMRVTLPPDVYAMAQRNGLTLSIEAGETYELAIEPAYFQGFELRRAAFLAAG